LGDLPAARPPVTVPRRKWLCVAYAFPPINRSGTHRTLGFVRHLAHLGWDATVLSVRTAGEPVDTELLARLPSSARVIRTRWIEIIPALKRLVGRPWLRKRTAPNEGIVHRATGAAEPPATPIDRPGKRIREWVSRLLMTPDSRIGWIPFAVAAGWREMRRTRPSLVYSTSPYASAHLIALLLATTTRTPWVADFRDPWRDNPFRVAGPAFLEWLDTFLERSVFRLATHVVFNTPTAREAACLHAPFLRDKSSTILNGFDPGILLGITPVREGASDEFILAHAGEFYGTRTPLPLFEALRWLLHQIPHLAHRIRLLLIGPGSFDGIPLIELARNAGVERHVRVLGRRSHHETLARLAGSDAVLVLGSAGSKPELQVPNKLFELLALRKPMVVVACPSGPVAAILQDASADALQCAPNDIQALAEIIRERAIRRIDARPDPAFWRNVNRYDRIHRAAEMVNLFNHLSSSRSGNVPTLGEHRLDVSRQEKRRNRQARTHSTPNSLGFSFVVDK